MISFFVKRPVTTIIFVLVFVVLGIVSFFNLLIERTPRIDLPLVSIKTIYPGASPIEIETQMIKKIEDTVSEISDIKKIISYSYENYGFILIEFNIEADINIKSIEVKDKVEAIINDFPDGAKAPEIAKFDPLVEPILNLVLNSSKHNQIDLYEFADKELRTKIGTIEGVASIDIVGGKRRQINIEVSKSLMNKYFISINEVLGAIATKNINIPGGSIKREDATISVRFVGEYITIDDIKETVIVSRDGNKFKIKDIAKVSDSFKKQETISRFMSDEVVSISVKKLSDGDAVSVANKIKKALTDIINSLPEGMELFIATDTTTSIVEENYSTIYNILIGILLTAIVLFIFLGNIRTTLIASLVIPSSLISAFFLLDFSNFSINMMSLLAIACSLGTLIANSLIIIEAVISRIAKKNEDPVTASINGTKEVSVAILASAGTNLVVFTPIAFMGGIVGQFMQQFGLTVVYVTIFSIIASFSLTPMLCSKLITNKKPKSLLSKISLKFAFFSDSLIAKFLNILKVFYNNILNYKFSSLFVILLLILASYFPFQYLGSEFFANYDNDIINIKIETPQGSSLSQTKTAVEKVETYLKEYVEVKNYLSRIGIDGYHNASIIVNLIPSKERRRSDLDLIEDLLIKTSSIASANIAFSREEMGDGSAGDMTIDLYGNDYEKLISISKTMQEMMNDTGFFRLVETSYKNPKKEIKFIPDQKKMIFYAIENVNVGSIIRTSINGDDSNIFREAGEEYKINLELDEFYKQTFEDIKSINVISKDGLLPISELGNITYEDSIPSIYRRDKQRVIQLYGYLAKSNSGTVQKILNEEFKKINFDHGFSYKYSGNDEMFQESVTEILKAFLLAVILTFMLLAAILNSFSMPFVIASSIITSFITAILFELYLEHSINIATLMSIVMLVGLVVNNGILLVDYALNELKEKNARAAMWSAIENKTRTIFMTSFAIIFGALPQVFDKMLAKATIGSVIIGGMLGSLVFTYIIIPILFDLFVNLFFKNKKA